MDSVLLARIAHEVLNGKSLAVIADSPSLPRRELQEALVIAEKVQVPVRVIRTREFENANYTEAADETRGQSAPPLGGYGKVGARTSNVGRSLAILVIR